MAVAFDAQSTAPSAVTATSVNHTALTVGTGSNRALVVLLAYAGSAGTVTVTWDSGGTNQAMTQITGAVSQPGLNRNVHLYGLVNPTSGNKTLAITISSTARNIYVAGVSLTGVDQTGGATSFPGGAGASGSSTTSSVTVTSASGDYVLAVHSTDAADFNSVNQTQVYRNNTGSTISSAGNRAAGAATVALTGTLNGSGTWVSAGASVKAAGGTSVSTDLTTNVATVSAGTASPTAAVSFSINTTDTLTASIGDSSIETDHSVNVTSNGLTVAVGDVSVETTGGTSADVGSDGLTAVVGDVSVEADGNADTTSNGLTAGVGDVSVDTGGGGGTTLPVFVSFSNTSYGASDSTIITKPSGVASGDIMLAGIFYIRSAGAGVYPTDLVPPSGWAQIGTNTTPTAGGYHGKFSVWWKRAGSSEPSSYSFDHWEGPLNQGVITAYSGAIASGDPVDVFSQSASNAGTSATYTGVTTTTANTKLALLAHNFTGSGTLSPPSGMVERFDSVAYAADEDIASAGATGDRSHTVNSSTDPWSGFLVALKGSGGGGGVDVYVDVTSEGVSTSVGTVDFILGTGVSVDVEGIEVSAETEDVYVNTNNNALIFAEGFGLTVSIETVNVGVSVSVTASGEQLNLLLSEVGLAGLATDIVFRSTSNTGYGPKTNTVIDKPAGVVNNDILFAAIFAGGSISPSLIDVIPPAGWLPVGTVNTVTQTGGGFSAKFYVFWKRASDEGSTYTFIHDTLATQAAITSYSGCMLTGNVVDVYSQNFATIPAISSMATATSITPSIENTKLLYLGHNWDGTGTLNPPFDMTERFDGIVYIADQEHVPAGVTGDRTQTLASISPWQAYLVALTPETGKIYLAGLQLTVSAGEIFGKVNVTAASDALTVSLGTVSVEVGQVDKQPPIYQSISSIPYLLRSSTIIDKPTGVVEGDVMLAGVAAGDNTLGEINLTPPTGWTLVGTRSEVTLAGFTIALHIYWKRAGASEPASYTWGQSHANSTQAAIAAYSRVLETGDPVDVFSKSSGFSTSSGNIVTYTGVTTTLNATKLALMAHNWDGTGLLLPPAGMAERFDNTVYVADEDILNAGPTGNRTQNVLFNSGWAGFLVALKPEKTIRILSGCQATVHVGSVAVITNVLDGQRLIASVGTVSFHITGGINVPVISSPMISEVGNAGPPLIPLFREKASTSYGLRGSTTILKPVGVSNDDVLLAGIFAAVAPLANVNVTPPAGWSQIGSRTLVNQGSFYGTFQIYWKRAFDEGDSYTWTQSHDNNTQGLIVAYSGCKPTSTPINSFSVNSGNNLPPSHNVTYYSVTTSITETRLVLLGHNWNGSELLSPPAGMVERFDSIVYAADEALPPVGASGDRLQGLIYDNPWAGFLVALKPNLPYSGEGDADISIDGMTASVGNVEIIAITLGRVIAEPASYSFEGTLVEIARALFVDSGVYEFTGSEAYPLIIPIIQPVVNVTGFGMTASVGDVTVGINVTGYELTVSTGDVEIDFDPYAVLSIDGLTASVGTVEVLSGFILYLDEGFELTVEIGEYGYRTDANTFLENEFGEGGFGLTVSLNGDVDFILNHNLYVEMVPLNLILGRAICINWGDVPSPIEGWRPVSGASNEWTQEERAAVETSTDGWTRIRGYD